MFVREGTGVDLSVRGLPVQDVCKLQSALVRRSSAIQAENPSRSFPRYCLYSQVADPQPAGELRNLSMADLTHDFVPSCRDSSSAFPQTCTVPLSLHPTTLPPLLLSSSLLRSSVIAPFCPIFPLTASSNCAPHISALSTPLRNSLSSRPCDVLQTRSSVPRSEVVMIWLPVAVQAREESSCSCARMMGDRKACEAERVVRLGAVELGGRHAGRWMSWTCPV